MRAMETLPEQTQAAIWEALESGATLSSLCEITGLSRSRIRTIVERLVNTGMVDRAPASPQGRGRPPMVYTKVS